MTTRARPDHDGRRGPFLVAVLVHRGKTDPALVNAMLDHGPAAAAAPPDLITPEARELLPPRGGQAHRHATAQTPLGSRPKITWIRWPGTLADGRYITGQSLPGYPKDDLHDSLEMGAVGYGDNNVA